MRVGSLFSGAGCGDLGLEWAGFEHVWFCETDEYARKILALRWPEVPIYGDIRDVDFTNVPLVDMLTGGFPCQDISVAGKGSGISGSRSVLWREYARAIGDIRPRYALIENSPALVGRGLDVVLSDLAALGYDAEWRCLCADVFGAPHKRERLWIIAYTVRNGGEGLWETFELSKMRSWWSHCKENLQQCYSHPFNAGERFPQPLIRRIDHGTPHRVDRLRCIGNGQVPHCTDFIGRCIMNHSQRVGW